MIAIQAYYDKINILYKKFLSVLASVKLGMRENKPAYFSRGLGKKVFYANDVRMRTTESGTTAPTGSTPTLLQPTRSWCQCYKTFYGRYL